ncbi:SMC-Scp complex subunit ScpB [Phaeovibrio sulfidiphilus]|uniref:SMC-Scp complex subunit ScpB n=2 Tax=Phaeovibrio sulfidiphilus TaxID=1220600 RepID=A0A8J6Z062_9PROT|nr:SMC-Scp complex subunit ScpB [Phaeovibrio sulfidiphilus]
MPPAPGITAAASGGAPAAPGTVPSETDDATRLRIIEAMLFASRVPLTPADLATRFPEGTDIGGLLTELQDHYRGRGVELVAIGERWSFRTSPDLSCWLREEREEVRKLSRAGVETLAVIAYHQPVTRADIEEIRGVALSKGTLDTLLEAGWIRPCGRRQTVGRPLMWGTTEAFLDHFSLESLEDLPGIEDLRAAGLLDVRPALAAYGARGALSADDALEDVEKHGVLTGQAGADGDPVQLDLLRPPPVDPDEDDLLILEDDGFLNPKDDGFRDREAARAGAPDDGAPALRPGDGDEDDLLILEDDGFLDPKDDGFRDRDTARAGAPDDDAPALRPRDGDEDDLLILEDDGFLDPRDRGFTKAGASGSGPDADAEVPESEEH